MSTSSCASASPADRAVWQPLTIYRELGDGDQLGSVVSSTLPALVTPAERNALRIEHAEVPDRERSSATTTRSTCLRDALAERSGQPSEAAQLYEDTLRMLERRRRASPSSCGRRFEGRAAPRPHRDSTRSDVRKIRASSDLLEKTGLARRDPRLSREAALIVAPDDREILRRVVAQLDTHDNPREGALLMERLLAVESPERAPVLAGKLATMWEAAGDFFKGVPAHRSSSRIAPRPMTRRSTIGSRSGIATTSSGPSSPSS